MTRLRDHIGNLGNTQTILFHGDSVFKVRRFVLASVVSFATIATVLLPAPAAMAHPHPYCCYKI